MSASTNWRATVETIRADFHEMCEGRPISRGQLVLRLAVHSRWRAVVLWRLAQLLIGSRLTKPIALWLTDVNLAMSGAELQPTATVGPGLVLKHTTGLVVGGDVVAGARLTLHQNVTLGDRVPYGGQPTLGDGVVIGAGACVLGPLTVGDRAVVAANAVVLSDIPAGALAAGNPAVLKNRTPRVEAP